MKHANIKVIMSEEKQSKNKDRRGVIYKIHCLPENKSYVGQTRRSFKKRWSEHCYSVEYYGWEASTLIDCEIYEYGKDAFEIEILERPLVKDLNAREIYWTAKLGTKEPNGYNQNKGGGVVGRIELTEDQKQDIITSYESGESSEKIAIRIGCGPQFILDFLRNSKVEIRSQKEVIEHQRKNIYYRLDPITREVLEEYKSFSLIGKWAQQNGLTEIANASTAGLKTRYAMLFDTEAYGYKWDASWSEEEKAERRQSFGEATRKSHSNENAKSVAAPSRSVLKEKLQETTRKEILALYDISQGCLDNWKFFYRLGSNGEDLDGWESAPEQYEKSLKNGRPSIPSPTYEVLRKSIEESSLSAAAKSFDVGVHIYKKWLSAAGLPNNRADIDAYLGRKDLQSDIAESKKEHASNLRRGSYKKTHMKKCNASRQRSISNMPSKAILASQIKTGNFTAVAKQYGVTDNCIRKWCRKLNLPDSSAIIKNIHDDEWEYVCEHWIELKEKYRSQRNSHSRLSEEEIVQILKLHESKMTIKEISEQVHRDAKTIRKCLRDNKI